MELHAVDPLPASVDQEFRHPHRAEPVARTYPFLPDGGLAKVVARLCEEFDKQTIIGKDGKVRSSPTNLANSKYTVYLHMESKGEVPHLHAAICRFDENGNINNDHNIHLRAQRAAERVAVKHGWKTAEEIRSRNIPEVSRECMEVLRTMPSWSWEEYKKALARRGYSVYERKDKKDVLRGYAILKGNTKYKASELGVARNLMISKLPRTWQKLHYRERLATQVNTSQSHRPEPVQRPAADMDYTHYRSGSVSYTLSSHGGREQRFYIPERVLDYFNEEFDYREVANSSELTDIAVAIFVGMLETPAVSAGSGGGGSQSDLFLGETRMMTTCNGPAAVPVPLPPAGQETKNRVKTIRSCRRHTKSGRLVRPLIVRQSCRIWENYFINLVNVIL